MAESLDPTKPLDLIGVRAAVSTWEMFKAEGASDGGEDNVNLASYAAGILPVLCDEVESLRLKVAAYQEVMEEFEAHGRLRQHHGMSQIVQGRLQGERNVVDALREAEQRGRPTDRCPARHHELRCRLEKGHPGPHV